MKFRRALILGIVIAVCICPASAQDDDPVPASGKFEFKLRNGTAFSGFMTEKSTIEVLVAGMEIKVPIPLVESIRFDGRDSSRIRMTLNNGDSLSGQVMPGKLEVVADWGTLKINTGALTQITRVNEPPPPKTEIIRPKTRTTTDAAAVVPESPARNGED